MGQPCGRNENGVESFRFSGEKMETERNQRFVLLDRAIELKWEFDKDLGSYYVSFPDDQ